MDFGRQSLHKRQQMVFRLCMYNPSICEPYRTVYYMKSLSDFLTTLSIIATITSNKLK